MSLAELNPLQDSCDSCGQVEVLPDEWMHLGVVVGSGLCRLVQQEYQCSWRPEVLIVGYGSQLYSLHCSEVLLTGDLRGAYSAKATGGLYRVQS
jgi:hypothetical protein